MRPTALPDPPESSPGAAAATLGRIVERTHLPGPRLHVGIIGMGLLQRMPISQPMHPAAQVRAGIAVVAALEIAHPMPSDVTTQDAAHDVVPAVRILFVGAHGVRPQGAKRPDVPVLAVFAPPRFIAIPDRAGAGLRVDRVHLRRAMQSQVDAAAPRSPRR